MGGKFGKQVCTAVVKYYSNAADIRGLLSTFVIALLNTAPSEQTVDVEFTDAFFDQVRHTCLAHFLC